MSGAAATSHPAATLAAVDALRAGGNAVDAAVTAALLLGVVEPMSVGIGGDAFALVWSAREGRLLGYAGAGASPAGLTPEGLAAAGHAFVPERGPWSITVPGALDAFAALLGRLGTRSLGDCLAPAVTAARDGFVATEVVARSWATLAEHAPLPAPREGEFVRMPALATSLERLARGGREELYGGALGRELADGVRAVGGVLALEDLAQHRGAWVEPLVAPYRGARVAELPPPGQGVTALLALRLLDRHDLRRRPWDDPVAWHLRVEAVKRAMTERDTHVADPAAMHVSPAELLSDAFVARCAARLDPDRADRTPATVPPGGGTVYLATADRHGNFVSLISSLFHGFGSGVVAGETGIVLQDRAHGFAPPGSHPNSVGPRKRPLHTIIPAMLLDADGTARAAFGVMGGDMQAQGHVQVVSHWLDHGLSPQAALDAPRFRWLGGARVAVEEGVPEAVRVGLSARGHDVSVGGAFGGGQAIVRLASGALAAASDPRKDGLALAF
jgi:gamma-glutamyltranspeptidase/glutathione hydrolase